MKILRSFSIRPAAVLLAVFLSVNAAAQPVPKQKIPDALKPWETWATWDDQEALQCPAPCTRASSPVAFWPSELNLSADVTGAEFRQRVTVFSPSWVPLPGGKGEWPEGILVDKTPWPVLEKDGRPVIHLASGTHEIVGLLAWKTMPQRVPLPSETGIVELEVNGTPVEAPLWDTEGNLWLNRNASPEEAAGPDYLSVNLYEVLEDGIPLWLRTRVELIVSGKSREEDLGSILPEGWKVSSVLSPIPVALDESGRAKAQVRAGKWTIEVTAFRMDDVRDIHFSAGAEPAAASALVGFLAKPDFRTVELAGATPVDVTMTTFPEDWRKMPVYQWDASRGFQITQRLRGMGEQAPEGLRIARLLWLDSDGHGLTFRDRITGKRQQIWRLNAAPGQDLGSVRSDGTGQLITRDPATGAPGVEIRSRNVSLEATGRMAAAGAPSATGWKTDADRLDATLHLPPGWRVFALLGADWVRGDWLTSWSLLDIFVVLIFSLAVFRLWGAGASVLAFAATVLSYQERGAPQLFWLLLLAPLAILRFLPPGRLRLLVATWKWLTIAAFVFTLVPFLSAQIQQALYPQLESLPPSVGALNRNSMQDKMAPVPQEAEVSSVDAELATAYSSPLRSTRSKGSAQKKQNLLYEAQARIQTGPGVPQWTWRTVQFGWNGPVSAQQTFRPLLIPASLERLLTLLRIGLLAGLVTVLLGVRRVRPPTRLATALALACLFSSQSAAQGQFPDQTMLKTLRERLVTSDLPPCTAEIPFVLLKISGNRLVMEAQIHAATLTAVPLPGRLPAWSPVSVLVDGKPGAALRREDNSLWVALTAGVHSVRVEGLLGEATEWEWTFLLAPRRVQIEAPGWNISGVNPDGVPEQQVFFARQQKTTGAGAAYDRQDFQTTAVVERSLELGLVWQVRTTVRRLTPHGKAIALRVPLLPGENVLSANVPLKDGAAEVRLAAGEEALAWESELTVSDTLALATREGDLWTEQWRLVASPVWNVAIGGLAPVFEPSSPELVPVWRPWPGEQTKLTISRPQPVTGATVTVRHAVHSVNLGDRQRTSTLEVGLTSSLGEDFLVGLPSSAQVTSLSLAGQSLPVRLENGHLVVPLRPGEQDLKIAWKTSTPLDSLAQIDAVTLPAPGANIDTVVSVPANRWILWTVGPLRGPAVRFWIVLAFSLAAALFLGRLRNTPLGVAEWMLLGIGLTQVSLPEALVVTAWLFLIAWRARPDFQKLSAPAYDASQILIAAATAAALGVLVRAVGAGLLGSPEMFLTGNGSTMKSLKWYLDRSGGQLPRPLVFSVSVWWYRLAMLVWALWLASALLRWLGQAWSAFTTGGSFRSLRRKSSPPPVPPQ
jgi:hypothetical protein